MLNVGGFPLAACFLMRLYPAQELSENVKIFHVRLMAQKLKLLAWGGGLQIFLPWSKNCHCR